MMLLSTGGCGNSAEVKTESKKIIIMKTAIIIESKGT